MATAEARYRISADDRTRAATRRAAANFKKLKGVASRALLAIGGPALTGAAVVGIARMQEETGLLARQIGATTELMSAMRFVGDQANISFQTLATSIQRLQRRTSEAANGTGVAVGALERLGLPIEKFAKLNAEDKLFVLADAFEATVDPTKRLELAVALFDTEGAKMLRILADGAPALKKNIQLAREAGSVFGDDAADAAGEFGKNIALLKADLNGMGIALTNKVLPPLNKFITDMRAANSSGSFLGEKIFKNIGELAGGAAAASLEFFGFDAAGARVRAGMTEVARVLDTELGPATDELADSTRNASQFQEIFDQSLQDSAGSAKTVAERLKGIRAQQQKIGLLRKLIGDNRSESRQTGTFRNVSLSRFSLSSIGGNVPQRIQSPTLEKMLQALERIEKQLTFDQLALAG